MKYRLITGGAVLLTWLVLYFLHMTSKGYSVLIPVAVLAFFQMNEKRLSKYFNRSNR
jgi:hypothetical protein